jgi:hypothetical protein
LATRHHQRPFLSAGLSFAAAHLNPGSIFLRADVQAVLAGLRHREGDIGRIHLDDLAPIQGPHPQAQRALVQLDLRGAVA